MNENLWDLDNLVDNIAGWGNNTVEQSHTLVIAVIATIKSRKCGLEINPPPALSVVPASLVTPSNQSSSYTYICIIYVMSEGKINFFSRVVRL